jgi:hypothetical protein
MNGVVYVTSTIKINRVIYAIATTIVQIHECLTDLGKLNLLMVWFDFRLEPIYTTVPAAFQKTMLSLKVVKIDSKIRNSLG